eukprot:CAMPEP_0206605804 /NCGR_PEP_ID=MMETSP0325_2-20121206/50708_1 /ASSEMBLY_ACC=CAM_ASM_000347 /TAXON_ID=2866 /ORGANISM="Crypthecodinium cohnii, Strain Seligo" /LENGTH=59 /DNA_ID=CAMNT_0054121567 /DNA_START=276 /DNA_END=455 /DNA_ORIENTATION=+
MCVWFRFTIIQTWWANANAKATAVDERLQATTQDTWERDMRGMLAMPGVSLAFAQSAGV